jgi:ABC-type nitrate/sulfonate/bicarbonate transport system substrate-binding protein
MHIAGDVIFDSAVFSDKAQTAVTENYNFGVLRRLQAAPYRVAAVKGFWAQQGIAVNVIEYAHPLDLMRAAAQQRVDFAIAPPMSFLTRLSPAKVPEAIYLGTLGMADYLKYLILKQELLYHSLKGQTIGVFMMDFANEFLLSAYLRTVNTRLADIRQVVISPNELESNFLHNRLLAVLTVDLHNRFYAQANGVIAISTHEVYEPYGIYLVRKGGLASIPPVDLQKFLRGCVQALVWLRNPRHGEEYQAILRQFFPHYFPANGTVVSDTHFRTLMQECQFFDPPALTAHNHEILQAYCAHFHQFLSMEQLVPADVLAEFTYDKVVHNQALLKVLREFGT